MMTCAIVGDSIAAGIGSVQHECAVHAHVGAGTGFITRNYRTAASRAREYVVISMGSNMPENPNNYLHAMTFRQSITAPLVVWILPYDKNAAATIRRVARQFNDSYVSLSSFPSSDKVHPRNYRQVNLAVQDCVKYFFD